MTCDQARLSLGVYVLDALEPHERAAVDAHLVVCPECAAELVELNPLPGLLSSLTAEDVEGVAPMASPDGFERLLARAQASIVDPPAQPRRHRGWRVPVGAAAAAVVLLGVVLTFGRAGSSPSSPHTYQASQGDVGITVTLTSEVRGTAVDVAVRGVPRGERCTLVAQGRDGARETVGTWQVTYSGEAWSKVATSIPRAQLTGLQLLGAKGQTLVTMRV
jgi:anti-sigma factor RsiW